MRLDFDLTTDLSPEQVFAYFRTPDDWPRLFELDPGLTPAQKLVVVQQLMADGDERVPPIYETIGTWFGYAVAHYADFYDIDHVLVLGRVTSGRGGEIIVAQARQVLVDHFPELDIDLHVPDERMKRVGQSVAAASLPELEKDE